MSLLRALGLIGASASSNAPEAGRAVERRAEERRPVFQEAVLVLGDFDRIGAVITNVSSRGVRVQYSARTDLPFRLRLIAPTLKLNCWARVVWQNDGAAGMDLQEPK
jgi:hypothetical protein